MVRGLIRNTRQVNHLAIKGEQFFVIISIVRFCLLSSPLIYCELHFTFQLDS